MAAEGNNPTIHFVVFRRHGTVGLPTCGGGPHLPVIGASGPGPESETPRTSRSETCSTLQTHGSRAWGRPPGLPVTGPTVCRFPW
jgi:hypothetical protein